MFIIGQVQKNEYLRILYIANTDMKNFVEELKWRGMIHDIMPGTEEELM